jgi:hypothetical protein
MMGLHWENEWTENQRQVLPLVAQTLAGLEHLDRVLPFSFASPLEDHPLFAVVVLSDQALWVLGLRSRRDFWSGRRSFSLVRRFRILLAQIQQVQTEIQEQNCILRIRTDKETIRLVSWESPPYAEQRAQRALDFAARLEQAFSLTRFNPSDSKGGL